MRIRFKELLVGALLALALPIHADEGSTLILKLANGTTKVFDLDRNPVIRFTESEVNIKSDDAEESFAFDDLGNFSFWSFDADAPDVIGIAHIISVIPFKGSNAQGDKADVNGDGRVDIGDVLSLINKMRQ